MRLNGGACDIDGYSKKQRPSAHHPTKANARENAVDSNDQKPETCWNDYVTSSQIFCRVRSYLSTCREQGMTATQALTLLFRGKNPDFMRKDVA